jgi:hypothetical protein
MESKMRRIKRLSAGLHDNGKAVSIALTLSIVALIFGSGSINAAGLFYPGTGTYGYGYVNYSCGASSAYGYGYAVSSGCSTSTTIIPNGAGFSGGVPATGPAGPGPVVIGPAASTTVPASTTIVSQQPLVAPSNSTTTTQTTIPATTSIGATTIAALPASLPAGSLPLSLVWVIILIIVFIGGVLYWLIYLKVKK